MHAQVGMGDTGGSREDHRQRADALVKAREVRSLQVELGGVSAFLQRLQASLVECSAERDELRAKLQEERQQVLSVSKQLLQQTQEQQLASDKLEVATSSVTSLSLELQNARGEIRSLRNQVAALEAAVRSATANYHASVQGASSLRAQVDAVQQERAEAIAQRQASEAAVSKLQYQLHEGQARVNSLEQELEAHRGQLVSSREELDAVRTDFDSSFDVIRTILATLQECHSSCHSPSWPQNEAVTTVRVETLPQDIHGSALAARTLAHLLLSRLQDMMNRTRELQRGQEQADRKFAEAEEELQQLRACAFTSKDVLSSLETEARMLRQELQTNQDQLQALQERYHQALQAQEHSEAQMSTLKAQELELDKQLEAERNKCAAMSDQLRAAEDQNRPVLLAAEAARTLWTRLGQPSRSPSDAVRDLVKRHEQLHKQFVATTTRLAEADSNITMMEQQLGSMREVISQLSSEVEVNGSRAQRAVQAAQRYRVEVAALQRKLDASSSRHSSAQRDLELGRRHMQSMNAELEVLRERVGSSVPKPVCDRLRASRDAAEAKTGELLSKIATLETRLSETGSALETAQLASVTKLRELSLEVRRLEASRDNSAAQIDELSTQLEHARCRTQELEAAINQDLGEIHGSSSFVDQTTGAIEADSNTVLASTNLLLVQELDGVETDFQSFLDVCSQPLPQVG